MMGIYTNGLLTSDPFPIVLPKLCMFVTYLEVKGTETEPPIFSVYMPGDDDENPTFTHAMEHIVDVRVSAPHEPIPDGVILPSHAQSVLPIRFPVMLSSIEIREPGFVRVRVQLGDRIYKLGSLLIASAPPNDAAEIVDEEEGGAQ
ncbi:hypothetical protein [Sphingomonas aurantiaca]|uniref:hypothetical protein n=1 Tax=Sphingomonas aurantiaca TaxID=185949 RepID=UPI00334A3380